jgi:hypothetical protein
MKKQTIQVKGLKIDILKKSGDDYISITNIAKYKNPKEPRDVIKN